MDMLSFSTTETIAIAIIIVILFIALIILIKVLIYKNSKRLIWKEQNLRRN